MRAGAPVGHRLAGRARRASCASSSRRPRRPRASCSPRARRGGSPRRARRRAEVLAGDCDGPEEVVAACGERPVVAHDAKALRSCPRRSRTTRCSAPTCSSPARRGYPFAELCEERGLASDLEDPLAARRRDAAARSPTGSASRSPSAASAGVMGDIELPLVRRAARDGAARRAAEPRAARARSASACARSSSASNEEIFALADEEFTIGSPQQLGEILFERLGLSRKRRGKTGYSTDARVLQAIRSEHEIVPKIERWRELSTLVKTYLDVLPEQVDERVADPHDLPAGRRQTGRLSSTNPNMQNVPIRTPLGREIRGCFEAERGQGADLRRLLADRAARARARRRGGRC